ncbi:MAG: slipin family protein, partial [Rhodospirillales bacterium]|nr:slipin family protein [Rhodospirillales bacterium]
VLQAARLYGTDPNALKLRQMNLLYEMNKERGATVLIPTEMATSLGAVVALEQALAAAAQPPVRPNQMP